MEKMTTVEQVLRQGGSVEDVMAIVQEEIEKVNAKLRAEEAEKQRQEAALQAQKEQEQNALLDVRRKELTAAVMNYMIALNILKEEDLKDIDPEEIEAAIKETEKALCAHARFLNFLKMMESGTKAEPIKKETPEVDFENLLKHIAKSL